MPERVVYNPGPLAVQIHTGVGVHRVEAGGRATVDDDAGPAGDHVRALLRSGALRDEGPVPQASPPAPSTARKKRAAKRSSPSP
jgi:hypothetical protein